MLVRALAARGATVEVVGLPWRRLHARAVAENLTPWPASLARSFDVVVQDELVHPAAFARNRGLRGAVPVVALVHNLGVAPGEKRAWMRAAVERRYLRGVDGAIAVCAATLADVRAVAGAEVPGVVARAGRDHLAPVMDDAAVNSRSREPGPLRLLFVGTVMPHKGLHRLLDALVSSTAAFTLDVAGSLVADAAYVGAVRRRIARQGWERQVRLHGELHGDQLWQVHRASHLLVLPSDREAYSLACLDALGFGLGVLVTARGGMREMIADGVEGRLLGQDGAEWEGAVRELAGDRGRVAAMGRAALARYASHGTWGDTAEVVEKFLEGVVARVRGPQRFK
jgi:glycosyltransferase involved in cell wall biosynthesis